MNIDNASLETIALRFRFNTNYHAAQFFGRGDAVRQLAEQFFALGKGVVLTGKRRIGRSWLLKHLYSRLGTDPRFVILPRGGISADSHSSAAELLLALVHSLRAELAARLVVPLPAQIFTRDTPAQQLGSAVSAELQALSALLEQVAPTMVAVLLIDEIEALFRPQYPDGLLALNLLSTIAQSHSNICLLVAGLGLLREPPSALLRALEPYQLYGIGEAGARALLADQLHNAGVALADETLWQEIAALTGYEPMLLRLLGQALAQQAQLLLAQRGGSVALPTPGAPALLLGADQLAAAAEATLHNRTLYDIWGAPNSYLAEVISRAQSPDKAAFRRLLGLLAHHLSDTSAEQQRLFAAACAKPAFNLTTADLDAALRHLCDVGVLAEHVEPHYRFSSALLRRWLKRQLSDPGL